MKKILITGCSGYIGSHLIKLLEKKYEIHGLDIINPIVPVHTFYQLDVTRPIELPKEHYYHAVIHLAALVNVKEAEQLPMMYYFTNINGTTNVLNKVNTNNFIFASTGAAEYAKNVYGLSKRAAEDCVKEMCQAHKNINFTIFRFYNVIGSSYGIKPTNPDSLFHNLITARTSKNLTIFGDDYEESWDGTAIRDYVHVMEICTAINLAIDCPSNKIENLGHGIGHTVKEIANKFKEVNQYDFEIKYAARRDGDLPRCVLKYPSEYMIEMFTLETLLKIDD